MLERVLLAPGAVVIDDQMQFTRDSKVGFRSYFGYARSIARIFVLAFYLLLGLGGRGLGMTGDCLILRGLL